MLQVFSTPKQASDFAKQKNKNSRVYKYITLVYPKSEGGNGKKIIVKRIKK